MELSGYLRRPSVKIVLGSLTAFLLFPVLAFSQDPFYKGKTITIAIGSTAGGLADASNRALVPFLQKYIPGQPTIILQYMPGGGGRKAANYIYGVARPNGLTVAWTGSGLVPNFLLGLPGVEYDVDKLIYLGGTSRISHYPFFTRKELGLDTLKKLRTTSGIRIGSRAVGHHLYVQGRLFAYLLGLKEPRFVTGYPSPEQDAAFIRGELDTRITTIDVIINRRPEWLEKIDFHVVFEVPKGGRNPRFAHLPEVATFATSEKERKLLELWRTQGPTVQPYVLPPGTPKEQVKILQEAFGKALQDPGFTRDFEKLTGAHFVPVMPEKIDEMLKEVPRDPEVVELLKKVAGAGPLPPR